jgi:hypothetical protein
MADIKALASCKRCQQRAEWAKNGQLFEVTTEERIEHLEARVAELEASRKAG